MVANHAIPRWKVAFPAALLAASCGQPAGAAQVAPADVYVLAGQSNMSGRGSMAELPAADRVVDPGIVLFGNDGRWHPALDPLDSAQGQVDAVSADATAAVGPGLRFARMLRRSSGRRIVLVPCARGGSAMAQWRPGGGRDTLYGSCVARVRKAGGRLAGLLWYQGETDAKTEIDAGSWSSRLTELVAAFRRDLAAPSLPVLVVRLADRPDRNAARFPAWERVTMAQARIGGHCIASVSAAGLPLMDDGLHLATAGQLRLGDELALRMSALRATRGCTDARRPGGTARGKRQPAIATRDQDGLFGRR